MSYDIVNIQIFICSNNPGILSNIEWWNILNYFTRWEKCVKFTIGKLSFRNSVHLLVLVLYPIYYWNYVYYATEMVVYHYRRNIFVDVMTWNKCVNLTFDTYHFAILPVYSFLFYYYFFQYWIGSIVERKDNMCKMNGSRYCLGRKCDYHRS